MCRKDISIANGFEAYANLIGDVAVAWNGLMVQPALLGLPNLSLKWFWSLSKFETEICISSTCSVFLMEQICVKTFLDFFSEISFFITKCSTFQYFLYFWYFGITENISNTVQYYWILKMFNTEFSILPNTKILQYRSSIIPKKNQ